MSNTQILVTYYSIGAFYGLVYVIRMFCHVLKNKEKIDEDNAPDIFFGSIAAIVLCAIIWPFCFLYLIIFYKNSKEKEIGTSTTHQIPPFRNPPPPPSRHGKKKSKKPPRPEFDKPKPQVF